MAQINGLYITPKVLKADHPSPGYYTQYAKIQVEFEDADQIGWLGLVPLSVYEPWDSTKHTGLECTKLSTYDPKSMEIVEEDFAVIFDLQPVLSKCLETGKWPGISLWAENGMEDGEAE